MQTDWKEVYRKTAERTGEDYDMYKDIGNYVFDQLRKVMKRPPKLIIKLRGVGIWYLRKKRLEIATTQFNPEYDTEKVELYNLFRERLKEYASYSAERQEVKRQRNEINNKTLLQASNGEDLSPGSSQTDPPQYSGSDTGSL